LTPPILIGIAVFVFVRPITQDELYHSFADQRTLLGIPNFWNVVSNLPFAIVGILGLRSARDLASRLLFAGVLLTAFGSAYYHWQPDTQRLLWDRLPMTIVFMSLFAIVAGRRLLFPLLCLGIASVIWWRISGDLRLYVLVQFVPMVMIPVLLLTTRVKPGLWAVLGFYALAKVAEAGDAALYSVLPLSGHTWKHLLAALATYYILRWRRTFV